MSTLSPRSAWHRLTKTQEQAEAEELQARSAHVTDEGVCLICDGAVGSTVVVSGVVHALTLRPRQATPALEVDLYDGSGHVRVIWLGRRSIPGITAGRSMVVCGRLTDPDGHLTIYNPKYRLLPTAG